MPDVRNCRRCGKVYNYIGGPPICPACKEADEADFKRVKDYLYSNPGASLSQVSTELEISVEKIKGYLKEGRLEIIGDDANIILECESCGKSIRTGRLCDSCARELEKDLNVTVKRMNTNSVQSDPSKRGIGMRYLNKEEKK